MITFKQFISEKFSSDDIRYNRQQLGQILKQHKPEFARRLRVAPSSVNTTMPALSKDLQTGTTEVVVTPSAKNMHLGLGLDWIKLTLRHAEKLFRETYATPLEDFGFKITEVEAKHRSWEYGKVHHDVLLRIKLERL